MRLVCATAIVCCVLVLVLARADAASALTTIDYPDFSNTAGLQLNGPAGQSDTVLQLTGAADQQASAYSTTRIDTGQSFSTSFALSMSNGTAPPADGMAFLLQSAGPTALSTTGLGGSLGYAGVSPSVAVEFDIFNGDPGDPGYVMDGAVSVGDQHVGITRNGDPSHHVVCATVNVPPDPPCAASLATQLYGALLYAWIDYSNVSHQLSVFVAPSGVKPALPSLRTTIDLAGALGASTFVGFSAATGHFYAQQRVLNWRLVSAFVPATHPDADRDGIPDATDHCPARAGGRYDRDHDGCPGPYRRMRVQATAAWSIPLRGVLLQSLKLTRVPAGATVRLKCPSCHVSERRRAPGATGTKSVRLRALEHRTLRAGRGFTISVTAPGYIGVVLRFEARRHGSSTSDRLRVNKHPFRRTARCLPPGSRRSALHCATRPT